MALKSLLKTAYGKLEIETDDLDITGNTVECWGITFEQGALTISGLNIRALYYYYQLNQQSNLLPFAVKNFEKYLLNEPHSFEYEDAKRIANEFKFSKHIIESLMVYFYLDDSASVWFSISQLNSDKRSFCIKVAGSDDKHIDDYGSWNIKVGDNDDIWVSIFEYVCILSRLIRNGELSNFTNIMNMAIEQ